MGSDGINSGNWHNNNFTLTISSAYSYQIWYPYDNRWRNDQYISFVNSQATMDFTASLNSTSESVYYLKSF